MDSLEQIRRAYCAMVVEAKEKETPSKGLEDAYLEAAASGDLKTAMGILEEKARSKGYSTRLFRVDDRHRNSFLDTDGIYFSASLDYYDGSDTGYRREDAEEYLLLDSAKMFDPMRTFDMGVNSWSWITMKLEDMERFGIEDETDWEETEGLGNTSTAGLAIAGKRLGYEGTVLRDIPNEHGWGKPFTEYALYESRIVKRFGITRDDSGEIIPLGRRFDSSNPDMRY